MGRLRYSILGLMAAVAFTAAAFAALRSPSELWASVLFTLVVALLLAAILGAVGGRGRLAWLGCALFGWSYLAAAFCPWPVLNNDGLRPPRLPTALLDDYLRGRLSRWGSPPEVSAWTVNQRAYEGRNSLSIGPASFGGSRSRVMLTWSPSKQILHSLGAALFAGIGAVSGHKIASRGTRPAQ